MSVVLEDESLWPAEAMFDLVARWIPHISLEDVNGHLKHFLQGEGGLVHFLTPTEGITEAEVQGLLESAEEIEVEVYTESVSTATLLPAPLPKSAVIAERVNENLEIREWIFENGVKVWLKQTDFDENMIGWSGYQEGGYSKIEDVDLYSAKVLTMVMQFIGAGPHSLDDISRLTDSVPGVFRWMISEARTQIMGQATREGLLPSLQHLWLASQHSNFTPESLDKVKSILTTRLSNDDDPETTFGKRRSQILNQSHPRGRRMELEDVETIHLNAVEDAYTRLIQPVSTMHFAVIGNFEWDEMRDVLSQTLGACPPAENFGVQDRGIRLLEDSVRHDIPVFDEPKGEVEFHFVHTKSCDSKQRYEARILTRVLQERLRKALREKEAGTYHVGAKWNYNRYTEQIHFDVGFGCSPERVTELESKALAIIETFVSEGITSEELELERGKMLRAYEKSIKRNNYWQSRMSVSIRAGRDLMEIPNQLESIHELTLDRMNDCIREFYRLDNCVVIIGLPKV